MAGARSQNPVGGDPESRRPLGARQSRGITPKGRLQAGLWLVATPIGHLGDMTRRAEETLAGADLILAEDTRVTRKLMAAFGIEGRVERCDEAATPKALARALAVLAAGGAVAFASDAGTPGVSDPGTRLAQGVIAAGHPVRAVPGASAVLAALGVSGLASERFLFAGFAPAKGGPRDRFLGELAAIPATLVLFETGPRLGASLAAMARIFGPRQACVARELTKLHEEAVRGPLDALAARYAEEAPPRGEMAVVIAAPDTVDPAALPQDDLDALLREALTRHRVKDAAASVAAATGLPRRDVYERALVLKAMDADDDAP